ncbi:hypothetical protein FSP39_021047 [Pinctada imbricata]|uniref:Inositol 1,4,5-trisphosphate receptor n=1 Tax=Pinctada imbricata TaxID=66713 RepID=A0AA88Y7D9_PINIB|nr:hypothetical protein FSP39_021047 [Pinctada imbricata]
MCQPIRACSCHLGFPISSKDTNLVEGIEYLLPVKFPEILCNGFRGELENVSANPNLWRPSWISDRLEKHKLAVSEEKSKMCQPIRACGGHLGFPIGSKNTNFVEGIEFLLPVKFRDILYSGFRGEVENVSVHNEIAVASNQNKQRPDFQDSQVLSFEVQVANRYKLYEKYIKLLDTLSKDPDNISLRNKVAKAKQAADLEREGNELIQDRQMGKKLQYGQIIQLRHLFTNKYIHVSTTNTSVTESNNMSVELKTENAIHAQYKVMPRYKVKAEGDLVQVDDQIVLESMRSPGSFLHVSKSQFGGTNVYAHSHEMNLSVQQSGFTVFRKYKPSETDVDKVKAGTIIRLFHREMEAYLVAEGLFNDQILEDVHLRMRPMDQENPKTMLPSTNPVTYWQIELSDGPTHGGCLKWEQQCKLIHLCSRKYLCIDKSGRVTLSADNNDPHTVFRLHPVIRENDYVLLETYCRIEHVVSGLWLHALNDEYQEKRLMGSDDPNSIASLGWSRAKLRQIGTMTEKQYDDAFTMQEVTPDLVEVFNFIAGMCPFIQKLIEDIVDLMVVILRMPFRGTPDQGHMTEIMVKAYEVLGTYLLGGSRKNELYIARYIDFFMSQFEYREGAIGLNAAHMVMELVRDNRQIKDRITHAHIDTFVDLLQRNKNYRYLDLLSVLCANDGVTIANNQSYITEKWLKSDNNKCVFHTSLGQEINLTHDLVYVSINQRKTWTELSEFAQDQQSEDYLFLVHQLELFGELCKGQNEFCIQVITEELNYLTWEEAFVCLTNEILPDDLRSKYCHLIVTMFVDIKDNHSVIDRIKLTYIYDSIDELEDELDLSHSRTYEYFPTLSKWMSEYLGRNSDMTASEIGSNMLIKQVLRLLQYLVSFGFYNKSIHFKLLLGPLMNLVDGRHDNPYPNIPAGREGDEIERRYREVDRYKRSIETTHVVNAKAQACHTLNLFLNLRENFRMERFMYLYKKTHMQANSNKFPKAELGVCLREDFDFNEHIGVAKRAVNRLKEIFESTSFLRDFGLVDVLKDLSQYEYDELIRVSMHLMNRNFSGLGKLISRALQAQVIITEKSVQICKRLEVLIPRLRHFTTTELNEEQAKEVTGILDQMIEMCYLDNEPSEEHGMNQSILYNHGVLDDIFTIFKQSVDVKLMEKYVGLRRTFQRSFILLKNMAKNNKMIQGRLCDRLDLLLAKDGAWEELAECLTEIFTGNADTCMKVTTKQIHKIMIVISKNKANIPQLFEPLNAIMKIEELDVPLKRNQGYVMQEKILLPPYNKDLQYLICMVDMLAVLCGGLVWKYIGTIDQTVKEATGHMRANPNIVQRLLKKAPTKGEVPKGEEEIARGRLHYLFDGCMEFLQDFLEAVTPLINILGQSKLAYDDYFGQELEMNRELNTFALNIQYANEGVNKLENEGNFDPEQELPSGQEFLDHLKCFIDNSKTDPKLRYRLSEKLVKQLIISTGLTHLSETEREEQEELDIRCLQLIRGLIQLEINNLPEDWEGNPNREVRKQLSIIEGVQNALDKNNVVTSVLDHLNRPQDEVVRETLLCMASLLFNGNNNIQMSFINYFYGTREEKFFFTVKKRMDMAASAISERRMLQAMHQAKMEEAMQQVKSLNRMQNGAPPEMNDNNPKSKALSRAASSTMLAGPKGGLTNGAIPSINGSMMSIARTAKVEPEKPDPKKNKQLVDDQEIKLDVSLESPSDLEFKDEYNIETLLLCLGLLCDNQCAEIQNYLREQPDNIKSANLVAEVTKFMNILFTNINEKSLPLVVQLFDTLVEFTSGNVMNRANVFENKICDYINFILRLEQIQGCTREEEYVLKKAIATLIKSLTEENPPEELDGDEVDGKAEVMQYLDTDLIVTTMVESYKDMLVQYLGKKGTDDENYQLVMDTGFSYYQLMKRKMDLDDTLQVKILFLSIVISVFITVVWRDPKNADLTSDINSFKPEYTIDEDLYQYLLYGVGGVHNFLCLCVLITFFLSNQPSFPPYRWLKTKLLPKDKGEDLRTWHEKMDSSNLEVQIYSFKTLYYFVFLGCSGMGTYWYGYFFAFHLLHIAVLNQLLKRVIEAVTTNGKSLILVTLLGLAIFFCYALVAFAFFRERFLKEESGRHCRTLGQCLITIIHHGVVESPYTSLEGDMSVDYGDVIQITMFDVTFFILVTTIGLNIIFGIIVDTFSQLRDSKWEIDKDMQRRCFICSRESYDFERHGGGFLKHVKEEHNQWAYLFFFIHLDETRPNDYTALELYVFNKLQTNTYDFFPLNKALCLLNEEDSQEQRMENMEMKLDYVMNTMKRQAADKEKVREKRRQQEWEAKHKNSKGNGDDQ